MKIFTRFIVAPTKRRKRRNDILHLASTIQRSLSHASKEQKKKWAFVLIEALIFVFLQFARFSVRNGDAIVACR